MNIAVLDYLAANGIDPDTVTSIDITVHTTEGKPHRYVAGAQPGSLAKLLEGGGK